MFIFYFKHFLLIKGNRGIDFLRVAQGLVLDKTIKGKWKREFSYRVCRLLNDIKNILAKRRLLLGYAKGAVKGKFIYYKGNDR